MPQILRLFETGCSRPLLDAALSSLAASMSNCGSFTLIRTFFVQRIFPLLLHPPNSPHFAAFASVIPLVTRIVPPPIRPYGDFAAFAISARPLHPRAAELYIAFVRWNLQNEFDSARRLTAALEQLDVVQKLFAGNPSRENGGALAEAIGALMKLEGFDAAGILPGRLSAMAVGELAALSLAKRLLPMAEGQVCAAWAEMAANAGAHTLASGIRFLIGGKPVDAMDVLEHKAE
jgi:hypothetical protein